MLKVGCVFGLQQNKRRVVGRPVEPWGNWTIPGSGAREKQLGLTPHGLGPNTGIQGAGSYCRQEVFLKVWEDWHGETSRRQRNDAEKFCTLCLKTRLCLLKQSQKPSAQKIRDFLGSYWQRPHSSIWVMLYGQRMLTGKQWQPQGSSIPNYRTDKHWCSQALSVPSMDWTI